MDKRLGFVFYKNNIIYFIRTEADVRGNYKVKQH